MVLGQWTTAAAAASFALLLLFSGTIAINLWRGNPVVCNCFGQWGSQPISWYSVVRNLGLAALAGLIASQPKQYLSVDLWWSGSPVWPDDAAGEDLAPVLLIELAVVLLWLLGSMVYQAAVAIAQADGGPALDTAERAVLRKLLRLAPLRPPVGQGD